jgi:hypothetical protein
MRGHFSKLLGLFALATVLSVGPGCATTHRFASSSGALRFFEPPTLDDPWTPQIQSWQARERALPNVELLKPAAAVSNPASAGDGRPAPRVGPSGDLRGEYFAFRAEHKRTAARELAAWIQSTSKQHYIPDGPVDHWATLSETLARNGDDCDGLELLAYHYLRDLGFRADEVYRAIVFRPSDKQHHMVTLWFENPNDPWVIDPTGAMTQGMPHLSEIPGWVPLKVFSETEEFTVRGQSLDSLIARDH